MEICWILYFQTLANKTQKWSPDIYIYIVFPSIYSLHSFIKNQQKHVFVFVCTHVCVSEGREKEAIRTSLFARYSFESLKAKAFI